MSLTIVVGGQFGSEGKGKVSAHIVLQEQVDVCVRCGGPNSGHSVLLDTKEKLVLRQLPVGVVRKETRLLIPAGAVVNPAILYDEIQRFGLGPDRVGVDRNALIMDEYDAVEERRREMNERISSTQSGTGAAVARRVMRGDRVKLAGNKNSEENWLRPFITNVVDECSTVIKNDGHVLIEGSQGFGLSLYHSDFYPKATSRDTSAAGALSEVGLSPLDVTDIVCVLRTFPIRVAGTQAGPLRNEISWAQVTQESKSPEDIEEYTSVTRLPRRVGRFDWLQVEKAIATNRPTKIAVMGVDYLNHGDRGKTKWADLSVKSMDFLTRIGSTFGPLGYIGTGPRLCDMINC